MSHRYRFSAGDVGRMLVGLALSTPFHWSGLAFVKLGLNRQASWCGNRVIDVMERFHERPTKEI